MINISKLDKAEVLAALYNNSRQQGMGFMNPRGTQKLSVAEARTLLEEQGERPYFDYLYGRVMKVEIFGDQLEPRLYDRDNGQGAAERALQPLLEKANAA